MKLDIIEPFVPMEDPDETPAVMRVTDQRIESLVSQYSLIRDQIRSLDKRRRALYPALVEAIHTQMRSKGIIPGDNDAKITVNDKQVVLQPRKRYTLDTDAAELLFREKGMIDEVARVHLTYIVPPSMSPTIARRLNKHAYNEWPSTIIQRQLVFDEGAIQQLYDAGELTDTEIDMITNVETIGKGFALYINDVEQEEDDASE